jgi:hypothetical protein
MSKPRARRAMAGADVWVGLAAAELVTVVAGSAGRLVVAIAAENDGTGVRVGAGASRQARLDSRQANRQTGAATR